MFFLSKDAQNQQLIFYMELGSFAALCIDYCFAATLMFLDISLHNDTESRPLSEYSYEKA